MDFLIFIGVLFLGLIPAAIAKDKGRNFYLWWAYGFFLFLIALVHSLLMKPTTAAYERQQISSGMVKCPHCAEFVKAEANVCRYCGNKIPAKKAVKNSQQPDTFIDTRSKEFRKSEKSDHQLSDGKIIVMVSVLLIVPITFCYLLFLVLFIGSGHISLRLAPGMISGYGLFSLWWLVLKFQAVEFTKIPIFIWTGLAIGVMMISLPIFGILQSLTSNNIIKALINMLMVFWLLGGPLVAMVTILLFMWRTRPQ